MVNTSENFTFFPDRTMKKVITFLERYPEYKILLKILKIPDQNSLL
jgi:hypothetical protein